MTAWGLPADPAFWLGVTMAVALASAGGLVASSLAPALLPASPALGRVAAVLDRVFGFVLFLAFFNGLGAWLTWAALTGGGGGDSSIEAFGVFLPLPSWLSTAVDRIVIGIVAALLDGISLLVWYHLLASWWRRPPR